jgi:hypothetical protein
MIKIYKLKRVLKNKLFKYDFIDDYKKYWLIKAIKQNLI